MNELEARFSLNDEGDYNHFYDKMCGEFSFLNSNIETKGYVQLMREKSGRN